MAVVEDEDGGPGGGEEFGVGRQPVGAGEGEAVAHDDAGPGARPGCPGLVEPGDAGALAGRELEVAPLAHYPPTFRGAAPPASPPGFAGSAETTS